MKVHYPRQPRTCDDVLRVWMVICCLVILFLAVLWDNSKSLQAPPDGWSRNHYDHPDLPLPVAAPQPVDNVYGTYLDMGGKVVIDSEGNFNIDTFPEIIVPAGKGQVVIHTDTGHVEFRGQCDLNLAAWQFWRVVADNGKAKFQNTQPCLRPE